MTEGVTAVTGSHIAVVDDDPSFREAMVGLLRAIGLEVTGFESALVYLEGLAGENQRPVDCLVLDVNMPRMTGPELQVHLAEAGIVTPIIFMTSQNDERLRARVLSAGAIEVLDKPCDQRRLLAALERALNLAL